jgi:hypothetical protein
MSKTKLDKGMEWWMRLLLSSGQEKPGAREHVVLFSRQRKQYARPEGGNMLAW